MGEASELPSWITPRFARIIVFGLAFSLVAISIFQATDNYYSHRRQDRQGRIIKDQNTALAKLSDRLAEDDAFFASVRQLILCGSSCTPEQRQAIIDELKRQDAAKQARDAADRAQGVGSGKASGSPSTPTSSSPTTSTTRPQNPNQPPPSQPPPSSPPPSQPPAASVCVGSTCVTIPSTIPNPP